VLKLEYIFLVGSIALIGADRIDLLGGRGFFRLTPFLFFASLVIIIRILVVALDGEAKVVIHPPFRRQIPFVVVWALFLFLAVISTILGEDPQRGVVALCGLILVSGLAFCISLRILADPEPEKLVVRSVMFACIVWLIFCVGGVIAWKNGVYRLQEEAATSLASMFAPTATLYWIPRLSGYCLDSNRAGFILVMYLALLDRFALKKRYTRLLRFAIGCFILVAVSRSAMLCWFAYYLFSSGFWKRLTTRQAVLKLATVTVFLLVIGVVYREEIATVAELWQVSDMVSDRLSKDPTGTAGSHLQLIERGFSTWTTSTRTVVAGIGFAGSPRVLSDFFGDNKYGNFHDLYVSVLAELGLPAFLLLLVMLGYPAVKRKNAVPFIAAIAIFNVFLQSFLEPIFWLTIALVWSLELKGPKSRNLVPGSTSTSGERKTLSFRSYS
jgi:hypothetical protein